MNWRDYYNGPHDRITVWLTNGEGIVGRGTMHNDGEGCYRMLRSDGSTLVFPESSVLYWEVER